MKTYLTFFALISAGFLPSTGGLGAHTIAAQASTTKATPVRPSVYRGTDRPRELWRISDSPAVRIGSAFGPDQLWSVIGVLPLSDESIVVADGGARRVHIFDSKANVRISFGRRGSGPGEFTSLWNIWHTANGIIGLDGQGRSQMFDMRGQFQRTFTPPLSPTGRRIRSYGYLGDGSLIGSYLDSISTVNGTRVRFIQLVRISAHNERVTSLGRHPSYEVVLPPNGNESAVVYGPLLHVAVSAAGYCVGYSKEYTVQCFDENAVPRFSILRTEWKPVAVNPRDRETFFNGIDIANPGPRGEAYRKEVRETTVFARTFPPFGRLILSDSGDLWVGPTLPEDETLGTITPSPNGPTIWSVFSSKGEWLSEVVVPARFRLMAATRNTILGIRRDKDDVQEVVAFRLLRGDR